MKTSILTSKINSGLFNVTVIRNGENIGEFETNDMQLVDDINELDNGFESELIMHESFDEVIETCIDLIK